MVASFRALLKQESSMVIGFARRKPVLTRVCIVTSPEKKNIEIKE